MTANIPLLVVSCDRYQDIWRPFFAVFRRQWPDCPYPILLGTNSLTCPEPGVSTIKIGEGRSWSDDTAAMLRQLGTSHVLMLLEDFFIEEPVDTAAVQKAVETAVQSAADNVRLSPLPPPTPLPPQPLAAAPDFGVVPPGYPYRVSTQIAVWRVETLLELLAPGLSIWEFEHIATQQSTTLDHVYWGPFRPFITYRQVVEKGRWSQEGIAIARDAGVDVDLSVRGAFTTEELAQHYAKNSGTPSADAKQQSIYDFLHGRRRDGLRHVLSGLRHSPADLRLWSIGLFGLLGPAALRWLTRQHTRSRLNALTRRSKQAS